MRMHTNEQPRQSGDKQELINASHLFCLLMGSLIHLLGELFFFLAAKQYKVRRPSIYAVTKEKERGKMQPTIWLICIHTDQSARIFPHNS